MALINCPECNNEISDRTESCPKCGFPINISQQTITSRNKYKLRLNSYNDLDVGVMVTLNQVLNLTDDYIMNILNDLPSIIKDNLDKEKAEIFALRLNKRLLSVDVLDSDNNIVDYDKTRVYCPKCYASNIQIVSRKWSFLRGIFTNKVDRVCMHCKSKF